MNICNNVQIPLGVINADVWLCLGYFLGCLSHDWLQNSYLHLNLSSFNLWMVKKKKKICMNVILKYTDF